MELTSTAPHELVVGTAHRERLDFIPPFSLKNPRHGQLVRYRGFVVNYDSQNELYVLARKRAVVEDLVNDETRTTTNEVGRGTARTTTIPIGEAEDVDLFRFQDASVDASAPMDPVGAGGVVYRDRTLVEAIPVPYESCWVEEGLYQSKWKRGRRDEVEDEDLFGGMKDEDKNVSASQVDRAVDQRLSIEEANAADAAAGSVAVHHHYRRFLDNESSSGSAAQIT